MLFNILKIYNDLDTRSKRCLIIDLYSILYIIIPTKYIIKRNIIISLVILLFQLKTIQGNDDIDKIDINIQYYQKLKPTFKRSRWV